jgi:PAP2 superfamily protein
VLFVLLLTALLCLGAGLHFRLFWRGFLLGNFYRTDDLLLDGVIEDRSSDPAQSNCVPGSNLDPFLNFFGEAIKQHEANLKRVAIMFSRLDPSQMELVSTIHYIHSSYSEWFKKVPSKDAVVTSVVRVKGHKFTRQIVERTYDILHDATLLPYPQNKWVKWSAYALSTGVSLSRYPAKKHYPADILIGATLGYVTGACLAEH